jgi:gluconate 2-dehydrogenase alpha chain
MTTTDQNTTLSRRAFTVFSATEARTAEALFERMFPADERGPGAREIGVVDYLDRALDGHDKRLVPTYKAILTTVDAVARARHGIAFSEADPGEQDDIIGSLAQGGLDGPFDSEGQRAIFAQLLAHLQEGLFADPVYGGNRDASGWRLLGHPGVWLENSAEENLSTEPVSKGGIVKTLADVLDDLPHDEEEEELKRQALANAVSPRSIDEVDVLLVGVGAMGGLVAQTFADAGLQVVGLEAGPWRTKDDCLPDELGQAYYARGGMGPKFQLETARWREDATTDETQEATFSLGRMVNGVGGSAGHYGAWLRRFHPWHFRPLTRIVEQYGRQALPEDCTLADWPVGYDELEPYYTRLEHLIGVAGDESNSYVKRSKPLPMPAMRPFALGERFREVTLARGLHPHPVAVGMNTVPYDGRPATTYYAWSNGLGSFFGDRWHPGLGPVPRAMATGRFELRTHCRVTRILTDASGARGVEYVDPLGRVRTQPARAVIIAAYTYETLRLMFLSADSPHPDGLGNTSGQLGKNYMTKMFAHVDGFFPDMYFNRHTGPAAQGIVLDDYVSDQFDYGPHGFVGGATLGAEQQFLPLQISRETLPPDVQPWGKPYRDHLLDWQRLGVVRIQPDSLSYAGHFVDVDPRHRDRSGLGLPVVRVTYRLRENERRLAAWMGQQSADILRAMGATSTWEGPYFTGVGSSHEFGVCRFGEDPSNSVLDPWLAVHDTPNLYVYGGSAFPSCPGINPTLTIWAIVLRAAEKLAGDLGGGVQ